jgi:hypothetical protein
MTFYVKISRSSLLTLYVASILSSVVHTLMYPGTSPYLVPKSKMVQLNLHSSIYLHGVQLS